MEKESVDIMVLWEPVQVAQFLAEKRSRLGVGGRFFWRRSHFEPGFKSLCGIEGFQFY